MCGEANIRIPKNEQGARIRPNRQLRPGRLRKGTRGPPGAAREPERHAVAAYGDLDRGGNVKNMIFPPFNLQPAASQYPPFLFLPLLLRFPPHTSPSLSMLPVFLPPPPNRSNRIRGIKKSGKWKRGGKKEKANGKNLDADGDGTVDDRQRAECAGDGNLEESSCGAEVSVNAGYIIIISLKHSRFSSDLRRGASWSTSKSLKLRLIGSLVGLSKKKESGQWMFLIKLYVCTIRLVFFFFF